ncbi:unnamed protein product (macronuclear) [Paramecium tetraurelia]|uniref:Uncharacterized protein n=1 Tax=Paramecium tetraurelia TaxID=5888 RepID=A0DEG0_PARTE|nr:uncharacterized protein GSPATT00016253001 [Paramecium tetraurelia]CAK81427.1 unnamed protein product [Paramecium tetraurelia]|eukprot:XP_001448824.1 hypothetical protein (macronuclear) [Paramecium tetraurelia strain d4-2]
MKFERRGFNVQKQDQSININKESSKLIRQSQIQVLLNQLLTCHLYDRMAQHCKNLYGLFVESYVPECLDARNYFQLCVRMNVSCGLAKNYFPRVILSENIRYFLTNEYSRPNPNLKNQDFDPLYKQIYYYSNYQFFKFLFINLQVN